MISDGDSIAVLLRESGMLKSTKQVYSIRGVQWSRPRTESISLPIVVRFRISRAILATALSSQRRFDTHLLTRLQIECVTLDFLNDVLVKDLSLEAFERAFQTLAIDNLHFSQRNSPQFLNAIASSA